MSQLTYDRPSVSQKMLRRVAPRVLRIVEEYKDTVPLVAAVAAVILLVAERFIERYDALILERHGALTVGQDLLDAYNKMEKLEHSALVILTALQLGRVRLLPPQEVEKLIQLKQLKTLNSC